MKQKLERILELEHSDGKIDLNALSATAMYTGSLGGGSGPRRAPSHPLSNNRSYSGPSRPLERERQTTLPEYMRPREYKMDLFEFKMPKMELPEFKMPKVEPLKLKMPEIEIEIFHYKENTESENKLDPFFLTSTGVGVCLPKPLRIIDDYHETFKLDRYDNLYGGHSSITINGLKKRIDHDDE